MANGICTIAGCEREVLVKSRGWCSMHYQRWQKHGDPEREPTKMPAKGLECDVPCCGKERAGLGMCRRHYKNFAAYGDPLSNSERTPMQRIEAVGWDVTGNGCWEWRGNRNLAGYGRLSLGGRSWLVPRLVLTITQGERAPEFLARHACDNPPCVNPAHLSWGSPQDNNDDMVERRREQSYRTDGWNGLCKNGLHDITLPGAIRSTPTRGNRCHECDKAGRRRANRRLKERDLALLSID